MKSENLYIHQALNVFSRLKAKDTADSLETQKTMKTITLENGKKVEISEESYKALEDAVREVTWKDIYEKHLENLSDFEFDSPLTQKVVAIKKMLITAKYLNGDWKPDWNNGDEQKWMVSVSDYKPRVSTRFSLVENMSFAYFKSESLAKRAISILGEETIRAAFNTDW